MHKGMNKGLNDRPADYRRLCSFVWQWNCSQGVINRLACSLTIEPVNLVMNGLHGQFFVMC